MTNLYDPTTDPALKDQTIEENYDQSPGRGGRSVRPGYPRPILPDTLPMNITSSDAGELPHSTNAVFSPIVPTASPEVQLDPRRIKQDQLDRAIQFDTPPHTSKWDNLAGIILAGTTGWTQHDPEVGFRAAQNLWQQPKQEYEKRRQERIAGLEHQIGDIDKQREQERADRREMSDEDFRRRQEKHLDWTESGGPETAKLNAESKYRDSQVDSLRKSGYSEQEIAEFRATGKTRDNMPKSDIEAIVMAHEIGPDGKPTPRAVQAAAAHKQYVIDRLKEIRAAKDPNDTVKLVGVYMSDLTTQRGQIDAELKALQNDKLSLVDPAKQTRIKILQNTLSGIDNDISAAREFIGKRVPGLGGSGAQSQGTWDPKAGRYVQTPAVK